MLKESIILTTALLLLTTATAQAAIYKTTDARGNVVYTDAPSKEAVPVNLPPLSIVPSLSPEQIAQANSPAQPAANNRVTRYQLSFAQPLAEQTVRKPDPVAVNVSLSPELANGDNLTILLDGVVIGNSASASVSTEALDRGAHQISARVMNAAGKIVSEASTTIYVQQNSTNSPVSRANRPAPAAR